jgi:hypothetical protein
VTVGAGAGGAPQRNGKDLQIFWWGRSCLFAYKFLADSCTTVSSSIDLREKSRFSLSTIPTVSRDEKYGVFRKHPQINQTGNCSIMRSGSRW